jgi:hypothetical protein
MTNASNALHTLEKRLGERDLFARSMLSLVRLEVAESLG